jgi:predicted RNase H-like HicB family nuclease
MLGEEEGRGAMKDVYYYESLPYHAVWEHVTTVDGDRYWQVYLREIPTAAGMGSTEDEALVELRERFEEYVRFRLDEGLDVPEPHGSAPSDVSADGAPHGLRGRGSEGEGSGGERGPGSDGSRRGGSR